jgi:hypothetical protein
MSFIKRSNVKIEHVFKEKELDEASAKSKFAKENVKESTEKLPESKKN